MRVFVTGANGFLGFAIVQDLLGAGHHVTGLVRSSASAQILKNAGAAARIGDVEDLDTLRDAASDADGVIHTAFYHQISHIPLRTRLGVLLGGLPSGIVSRFMAAAIGADRRAIAAMANALRRKNSPLVAAFATMAMQPGVLARETQLPSASGPGAARGGTELLIRQMASDVRASIVRLPPIVHGAGDRNGLLPQLIKTARKKGVSRYPGDGSNRWAAVHRLDAARLFRLALEQGTPGAAYHAVAEEGIPFVKIARALGGLLSVPVESHPSAEAARHFGFLGPFVQADNPVSSELTQHELHWIPTGPGTLVDLPASYANR